jgi:hypothetical protein
LATFAEDFAELAVDSAADWQIVVASMADPPEDVVGVLRPTDDDVDRILAGAIADAPLGDDGEPGFSAVEALLMPGGDFDAASGFLRTAAPTQVLFISDEGDSSDTDWASFVADLRSLEADPARAVVNVIGGDYPSGCATAYVATGFYEASVETGAIFTSICSTDWATSMAPLLDESGGPQSRFDLSAIPYDPTGIEVLVDGAVQTEGWTYASGDNAIVFDETHVPAAGALIQAAYVPSPDC